MPSATAIKYRIGKKLSVGNPIFKEMATIVLALGVVSLLSQAVSAQENVPVKNPPAAATYGPQPKGKMQFLKKAQPRKKTGEELLDQKLRQLDNVYVPIHWSDPRTGMAIGGHDPIAYFEDKKQTFGQDDFQYVWHGVAWRFKTNGNMKMFRKSPSTYAPVYAGYDPYSVSKGIMAAGQPAIWAVIRGRLYLFYNQVNRYLWQENYNELFRKAHKNWPELSSDIPRYKIIQSPGRQWQPWSRR